MKKALFALSLLVVAPIRSSEVVSENTTSVVEAAAPVVETITPVAPAVEVVPVVEVAAPAVEAVAPAVEAVAPAVEVVAPAVEVVPAVEEVKPNVVVRGYNFVKNGVVYSVVSVKNGVVYGYDKVTGTVERFTPQMILNAKDSVRNVIASYPLTAVALTAFVTVKAAEYFSAPAEAEENEDDSF